MAAPTSHRSIPALMALGLMLSLPGMRAARAQSGEAGPHHVVAHPAHHAVVALGHHPEHHPAGAHHAAHPTHAHTMAPARPTPAPAPAKVAVVPVAPMPVVPPAPPKGSSTGLPLPRFASLRADAVNLRGGPGTRYPIQWIYKRRDLPVRIEREFDVWRLVEASDGVKGWVHQATLVGTRTFVIPGEPADSTSQGQAAQGQGAVQSVSQGVQSDLPPGARAMRAAPQADAALVAVLEPGVVGRIRTCPAASDWCKVSVRDYAGWLQRDAFWGLLPGETILPP